MYDQFTQGTNTDKVETFVQRTSQKGVLDVMVVVDSSGSMKEEQINLSTKLQPLLSAVVNSDWRIAINTTDPSNGCIVDVVDNEDSNIAMKFEDAILSIGTSGSGNERGVLQAVSGLKGECLSEGWVRSSSTVAVVIVSDEDNCSDGTMCGSNDYANTSYLKDYLSSIRDIGDQAKVYGIISDPVNPCGSAYNHAPLYKSLAIETGGDIGDICEADYSVTLSKISESIALQLKDQYALEYEPSSSGAVAVKVNGESKLAGVHYSISGNVVSFIEVPSEGSIIEISYSHYSEMSDIFALKNKASALESVKVDGHDAAASLLASGNEIQISPQPAAGARIEVKYLNEVELIDQIAISSAAIENSIVVKIDGIQTPISSFDSATGMVSFPSYFKPGSAVTIDYVEKGEAILNYALAFYAGYIQRVVDVSSGQEVSFTTQADLMLIDKADHEDGKHLLVEYATSSSSFYNLEVVYGADLSTLVVKSGGRECRIDDGLFQVDSQLVDLYECTFGRKVSYEFSYDIDLKSDNKFVVDLLGLENSYTFQVWRVEVGGQLVSNYSVNSGVIDFKQNLPLNTAVTVEVRFY